MPKKLVSKPTRPQWCQVVLTVDPVLVGPLLIQFTDTPGVHRVETVVKEQVDQRAFSKGRPKKIAKKMTDAEKSYPDGTRELAIKLFKFLEKEQDKAGEEIVYHTAASLAKHFKVSVGRIKQVVAFTDDKLDDEYDTEVQLIWMKKGKGYFVPPEEETDEEEEETDEE